MAAIGFPEKLGQTKGERLPLIDFRLWFLGEVSWTECLRWRVRAFVRKSASFRDFVLTRILSAEAVEGARMVELEMVAHPDHAKPELATLYDPMTDGLLRIRSRTALAGSVMRHRTATVRPTEARGSEHTFWFSDPLSLLGVESAAIALGYVSSGVEGSAGG